MGVEVRRSAQGLTLELSGEWGAGELTRLEAQLAAVDVRAAGELRIATAGVTRLDLSGAWVLREFVRRAKAAGAAVSFQGEPPDQLRLIDEALQDAPAAATPGAAPGAVAEATGALSAIGRYAVGAWRDLLLSLAFLGRCTSSALASARGRARLRPISIARHVYDTGITAMPIVALIAFLISVIIAYMSAQQLRGLGADIYVVDLVAIGVLRELGVLLTAIIVAGRSGSAFTAQIGTMQVNQEIDAMRTIGLNPIEWLVLPRILALVLSMPLLAFWGNMTGLLGGAVACTVYLDFTFVQFFDRLRDTVGIWHFYTGMIKAPVFGFIIAAIGCFEGLQVKGSAESVGQLTTRSVVESIFCVIVLDAVFSIIFLLANV